jgi:hypothetical protein
VTGVALRLASAMASDQVAAALFLAGAILAMTGFSMLGPPTEHPDN